MKRLNKIILLSIVFTAFFSSVNAGNEDRVGSAGASQLLVNPWGRSVALGDASVANAQGIEATYLNIAGLANIKKMQIKLGHTNWLGSAGIGFNSVGYAQKIGTSGAIGLSVQSMNFGDVNVTTVDNPDGGIGVFSPRTSIINFGYAKLFQQGISGGLNFKLISESITNLSATGICFDAGVKYASLDEKFKIGITLKNLGPKMTYSGDGLATQVTYNSTGKTATLEQRTQPFELPSLLSMGSSYDFVFDSISKLSTMFTFTANSFSNDQYRFGLDYGFATDKVAFNLRAGYVYEKNLFSSVNSTTSLTGFTSGFSVDFNATKSTAIGLEYSLRTSSPFGLIHTFGTTIAIK